MYILWLVVITSALGVIISMVDGSSVDQARSWFAAGPAVTFQHPPTSRRNARGRGLQPRLDGGSVKKITASGTMMGTPEYISPEQGAREPIGPVSDRYSRLPNMGGGNRA